MARRVSWTNNSSGHDGTTIHRSAATMDPQALPTPIGTVAAGTTEYVDSEALADGAYYYRVQDYQGASVSAASDEQVFSISPDYSAAQVGDEIGGGIYAGVITYADNRQFHLIFGKQASEAASLQWGNYETITGADDPDDGQANQDLILASFDNGDSDAFYHCRDYVDAAGNNDYYLPARNELAKIDALQGTAEFSSDTTSFRLSSTENGAFDMWSRRLSDGFETGNIDKFYAGSDIDTRPVRRVPV